MQEEEFLTRVDLALHLVERLGWVLGSPNSHNPFFLHVRGEDLFLLPPITSSSLVFLSLSTTLLPSTSSRNTKPSIWFLISASSHVNFSHSCRTPPTPTSTWVGLESCHTSHWAICFVGPKQIWVCKENYYAQHPPLA